MTDHYFIVGGVDTNTNSATNWSLTSSGPNDTGVPTINDNIFFDQTIPGIVNAVLNCKDMTFSNNNNLDVDNDINVDGNYQKSSGGNVQSTGGTIIVKGNVTVLSANNKAPIEFIGDDTNLDIPNILSVIGPLILNKNVGKKLTTLSNIALNSFFADWTIEEGILDHGAFELKGSGDITMNGGSVTSSTGVLDQERYFLNDGILDSFKCVSSTSSNSTLFTDSATFNLMPSGGEFEFTGGNHWSINQLYTVFPVLILNKCTTCGQGGQWYAIDVHNLNQNKTGSGFIRGDFYGSGIVTVSGTQTFDGTGVQKVIGETGFDRLKFNKISGSLLFQNDFRFFECEVVTGAELVDFGTSTGFLGTGGGHLNFWSVVGLEFFSVVLNIATSGSATMNSTVMLGSFTVTQCQTLAGDLTVGGNFTVNDATVGTGVTLILNGSADQFIFIQGGDDTGLDVSVVVNKPSGYVGQLSDVGSNVLDFLILKGIWCTNEFNLDAEDITISTTNAELQKTPNSVITTVNPIDGTVTNVSECGKKNSILAIL